MVIVIMGVSGSGKTTLGRLLSAALGWPFYEGDAYHPPTNIDKMRRGIPLTDADRASWLAALRAVIDDCLRGGIAAVLSCSALKRSYRRQLGIDHERVRLVYLQAPPALIRTRLEKRTQHFMGPALLSSQYEALEAPRAGLSLDAALPPEHLVREIRRAWGI